MHHLSSGAKWVVGISILLTLIILVNIKRYEYKVVAASEQASSESGVKVSDFAANFPKGPHGEDQRFETFTTSEAIVYFSQRMIDSAVVEKDQAVYIFDKKSGTLKNKKVSYRSGLPQHLPEKIISREQAEAVATGKSKFSVLYYTSPESDIFDRNLDHSKPIWAVTSFDKNNFAQMIVVDATTGKKLGNGIAPPATGFSLSGPVYYGSTCNTSWTNWYTNAASWFNTLGYTTEAVQWPSKAQEITKIQDPNLAVFYELAHGTASYYINGCNETTSANDIHTWISAAPNKQFAFIGSCDGLCSTGPGTFAYEFTKGVSTGAATVGYCGMGSSACSTCWSQSVGWQDSMFRYMNQGSTIKAAFDKANVDYPSCGVNNCMRFSGDQNFALSRPADTKVPTASISSPMNGTTVAGTTVVTVAASDNVGLADVELYKDGALFGKDITAPYQFTWVTTGDTDGAHILQAKATDTTGNTGLSTNVSVNVNNAPDTLAPVVTFSTPQNGATVSGTVAIAASATDNVAVTSMTCYVNGTKLSVATTGSINCSWNSRKAAAGVYTLRVDATDAAGLTGTSSISVNVVTNSPGKK